MKERKQASAGGYSSEVITERIAQARSGGWERLNLIECRVQDNDLRKLLGELGVGRLRGLHLGLNQLSTLPPELGRLTALTELDLSGNQLSTLPPELGLLAALTELYLQGNQLSTLPPEIGLLAALTRLHLSVNRLSTLPPEIGRLTALTTLGLRRNQFYTLPPELGRLAALTYLDLSENQLSTLPPEIGQLTGLRDLDLSRNHLSALPSAIGCMTALMRLDLSCNELSRFPPELGRLAALTYLDLSENQLSTLPPEIGQLTGLRDLRLSVNRLSALPPEIGRLSKLTTLSLSQNRISSLPAEIGRLVVLEELDLSCNQLSALTLEIGQLTSLTRLDLTENQLSGLPAEIDELSALTKLHFTEFQLSTLAPEIGQLSALMELYLHRNGRLGIPTEILGPTREEVISGKRGPAAPSAILDYYFRTRKESERRALNEVKVILVGQGSVGKTSLVKQIVYNTFHPGEEKTEGIYIEKTWSVPGMGRGEKIQVNFWDFGGQEIMHATHQFFLTKRTLYLLVLDARKGENESNLQYWLKIIHSFGGDSPILVVINKCEQHHLDLNETRLRKDYPGIRGFFETSCERPAGIAKLKKAIEREICAMSHVFDLLPIEYFSVKKELESLAAEHNHITTREYYALCLRHGVKDLQEQDFLLRFLHDLGSVLSFNDPDSPYALRERSVLNPEWVTQGVYQILNKQNAVGSNGLLTRDDVRRILDPKLYPTFCHRFIIDMMQKFELCFIQEDGKRWLVPELLSENEPEGLDGEQKDALNLQYHYSVLPSGIICRFIVRRYENLAKPPVCWRSGVELHFDGCTAVVRSDKDKGKMFIAVTGPEKCRRGFLALIRQEFASIHATIPNLQPDERVPLPDKPEVTVSYKHLVRMEQARRTDVWPEGAEHSYTVAQLLDGIEDKLIRGWNRFGYAMLRPPLFEVKPETSFPEAWEVFCCAVLNSHYKTDGIYQRKPPEGGVDLYWAEKKIAYQCKSVEDEGGRFSVTKALASIDAALKTREHLPWEKYVLCSNVVLTGEQERKLREKLGDGEVEFLTPSFWQPRCVEQREHLRDRFSVLARTDDQGGLREMV